MGDIMDEKLGYIVMADLQTLFGTLRGYTSEVLHKFSGRPKGLMEPDYTRAGLDAMILCVDNHFRKTAELATHYFIDPSTMEPNVDGLILVGPVELESTFTESDMFHPKLAKIVNEVRVLCGGEVGFNHAIHVTSKVLARDRRFIVKLFDEISQDTGKSVYGLDETLKALESNSGAAVDTLVVWENLDINRYVMKNRETGETVIKHLSKEQEGNKENFNSGFNVEEKMSLVDWLSNEYRRFGCALEFVNNKTREGRQFCKGLEGIGAILRYPLDLSAIDPEDGEPIP
ncbi:hypothetical protein CARUB_v10028620mg [Capsella rubella]|uniref:eRF1 domain-containing protein n=1 Tax=Capsella rubella TaxID=81985 RepID=R0F1Q1_9BRAS|nr:eukaryotic peptide chain release factor subunit 1-1 [Capsella rubella]EOA15226.1 hypothetical protein CARUB_v10028620mg [Capsella rubella]